MGASVCSMFVVLCVVLVGTVLRIILRTILRIFVIIITVIRNDSVETFCLDHLHSL
jgi:hypothetical protein